MKKSFNIKSYNRLIYLFFCIILVLIGQSFLGDSIKYPFSYVFNPIYVFGSDAGKVVWDWKNALVDASSYIEEYNQMKEDIARLKIENSEKLLDYEEYIALKQHASLLISENRYVEAKILNYKESGEIIINKGKESGIQKGDTVVLGRVFLGVVSDVGQKSSSVRLPFNSSSSFEVVVVPSTIDLNKENRIDSLIKSTGVVIGSVDNIKIENMGINSTVLDGDFVLLRDQRIGEILVLGTLIGVSKNPASTNKNGYVSPIFDYANVLTVFVRIEQQND